MAEEFKWHTTLIPNDHEFASNPYVHGRISAVLKIFCSPYEPIRMGDFMRYSTPNEEYGYFFDVWTTDAAYKNAINYIELLYPGMCKYDIPYDPDQCGFAESEIDKEPLCLGRYG